MRVALALAAWALMFMGAVIGVCVWEIVRG